MSRHVDASKVEEMLRLIRVSLIVGAGYDIREWRDYVKQMPDVDSCDGCKWIRGREFQTGECALCRRSCEDKYVKGDGNES